MKVTNDSKVTFIYTVSLEDGTVVDAVTKEEPLVAEMGQNQLLPVLEEQMLGMEVGDKKDVTLKPEDTFGPYNESLVAEIPREEIQLDPSIKEDMYIDLEDEQNNLYRGKVLELNDEFVKIDFNHPLAGQTLTYSIEIIDIS
ncbi:FKBP-type peptidyl-prolyl cis-trans isomerase SlyD [Deferribacter desulfuricans SSM1]|uniref:Peptidyl-prolyl cis-trans isomerase n=1 Tax=Deferribacter desulfuricans (strain DSM 14783 / JCM 11476 / NBRC 101012 / SSM1) TaxID=639282 RepID=D3PCX0_DEFDS|nr:peptidylprolyl isomerase [Deferribacter desulfuricans]BAI80443.1 FKBP-type peptidyl-prolyl cis-trans isomerase SlyD [Deferribacter desulfuricans SSM1]